MGEWLKGERREVKESVEGIDKILRDSAQNWVWHIVLESNQHTPYGYIRSISPDVF